MMTKSNHTQPVASPIRLDSLTDEEFDTLILEKSPHHTRARVHSNARTSRLFSTVDFAALSAYWFGWSSLWMPLLVVLMPLQVGEIVGKERKGVVLGTTLLLGSIISLICAPLFGILSDYCTSERGKRRPFIFLGTLLGTLALLVMSTSPEINTYYIAFVVLSISNNMVLTPYAALVPDSVPAHQRGTASSWLGGMSMSGYLFGGVLTFHIDRTGIFGAYVLLIITHLLMMAVTVYFTVETPSYESPDTKDKEKLWKLLVSCRFLSGFFTPFRKSSDFRTLFISRFLIQMGIVTVQEYLQYYIGDALVAPYVILGNVVARNPEKAVIVLFTPMLLGAIISSVACGVISDYLGGKRKIILYFSGVMMAGACFLFALTRSFSFDAFLAFFFGIGYGAFSAIDWAMATDVLPSETDMGLWSLSLVLPNVFAAPIAGALLSYFERGSKYHLGYSVIFLTAVGYIVLGSWIVKKIERIR